MLKLLRSSNEVKSLIYKGDENLAHLGFTEHSCIFRHCKIVSQNRFSILLDEMVYTEDEILFCN